VTGKWLRLIAPATVALAFLVPGGATGGARASSPPVGAFCLTKAEEAHAVRFPSGSRATIAGILLGHGPVGIVFVHQSPGDVCDWMFYARRLAAKGYVVLPIDLNGFAASTPAPTSPVSPHWDRDVAAAAGFLRQRGVRKVVLVGASLGGAVVVGAAAQITPAISAVIDLSGPTETSGIDAVAAARRLRVPALYLASADDEFAVSVRRTYAATPVRLRRLLVVGGAGHGVGLLKPDLQPHAAQIRSVIERFIRGAAGG
jgi:pimeloyl-ACP methyl ester carboxylesterase